MGSFDLRLREYAATRLLRQGVHLRKGQVKAVRQAEVELTDGEVRADDCEFYSSAILPLPINPKPSPCL